MNTTSILTTFIAWIARIACRIREARRLQRDLDELARMGAHELSDLGLSHASVAAAAPRASCC
jgi:uncharacterized protein YjiS (DUF1127 family)